MDLLFLKSDTGKDVSTGLNIMTTNQWLGNLSRSMPNTNYSDEPKRIILEKWAGSLLPPSAAPYRIESGKCHSHVVRINWLCPFTDGHCRTVRVRQSLLRAIPHSIVNRLGSGRQAIGTDSNAPRARCRIAHDYVFKHGVD